MRTKEEILDQARADIESPVYGDTAGLWLQVRKIEVLIDLRDILNRKSDNLKAAELDNDTVRLIHSDKE